MTPNTNDLSTLTQAIGRELPYLRRYARALTGTQRTGDNYAAATLEAILEDVDGFAESMSVRVALFHAFHSIWSTTGSPIETGSAGSSTCRGS